MNEKQLSKFKGAFTGFITLTICSMLIWQYLHEGVPSHYLLHDPDLPSISNWWGGLLLPVLSWILTGRIQQRIIKLSAKNNISHAKNTLVCFIISIIYGAILSFSFINGYEEISSVMFPGILFFAIFFRVYREEFILGFILSMSVTFGAVLPTIFGSLIAILSAMVYFLIQFIWSRVKSMALRKQLS